MMKECFLNAFENTFDGRFKAAIYPTAVFLVSLLVIYFKEGRLEVLAEAETWMIGMLSAITVLILLFLLNLVRAPFKIKAKATEELSKVRARAKDDLKQCEAFLNSINPSIIEAVKSGKTSFTVLLDSTRGTELNALRKYILAQPNGSVSIASSGTNFGQDFSDMRNGGMQQVYIINCVKLKLLMEGD